MMRTCFLAFIIIFTITGVFCQDGEVTSGPPMDSKDNDSIDVTTAATPKGGKLKAAENGPVRSALGQPKIDLTNFQLSVKGSVSAPFSLSWGEIQEWKAVYSDTLLMYCVEGWEVWGNWKGIRVQDLLQRAVLTAGAKHVLFHCVDGYTTALPISYLNQYEAILAYEVNGKPLKENDGFPLRLIAFGKYGYKWPKWVHRLEVIDEPRLGYWENYGYPDEADVPLERRIYYEGTEAQPLEY